MPANTSPDNIEYPVSTDPVAPLETVFANMANSVQDAFDGFRTDWNDFEDSRAIQTFRWADAAARAAQTGMVAGDIGYQVDMGVQYRYTGSAWRPAPRQFIGIATRTTTTPALNASTFTDLSANANWTGGGTAYSNGWVVPFTGVYEVGWEINVAGAMVAGVTVNQSTSVAISDLLVQASADVIQGVGSAAVSAPISLVAGDVVRLFAIAGTGTPALRASLGRFWLMNEG